MTSVKKRGEREVRQREEDGCVGSGYIEMIQTSFEGRLWVLLGARG